MKKAQWNVTPCIRRGSNIYFFAALYFSVIGFDALFVCLSSLLLPACSPEVRGSYLTFVHIETRCVKIIPQRRRLHSCYINVTCKVLKISSNINNRYQPLVSYLGIRLCSTHISWIRTGNKG